MECGGRLATSTVRQAATSAWPITWPPNTRCQPACGLRPRKRFTSSGSRSRISRTALTASDMDRPRQDRDHAIARNERMDVLIAGAGFAGLALASALRQSREPAFSVAIADP